MTTECAAHIHMQRQIDWCDTHNLPYDVCMSEQLKVYVELERVLKMSAHLEAERLRTGIEEARLLLLECGRRGAFDSHGDNSFTRWLLTHSLTSDRKEGQ